MKPPVRDQEEAPVDGPASKNDEGGGPGVALRAVNPGTLGHPHVCRRRCVHLSRGNCRQGANCGYCHLDHTRVTKLDKKHRAMLDELPKGVLMLTVLHFLRLNAEEMLGRSYSVRESWWPRWKEMLGAILGTMARGLTWTP
eukprot:g27602.t1